MRKQKAVSNQTRADRTWKQFGPVIHLEYLQGSTATQEQFSRQAARAVAALSSGDRLLPDFILQKVEASILRAVQEYATSSREIGAPANETQVRIYVAGETALGTAEPGPAALGAVALPEARWSYFLVQRRGDQTRTPQLFLDLYLYQE